MTLRRNLIKTITGEGNRAYKTESVQARYVTKFSETHLSFQPLLNTQCRPPAGLPSVLFRLRHRNSHDSFAVPSTSLGLTDFEGPRRSLPPMETKAALKMLRNLLPQNHRSIKSAEFMGVRSLSIANNLGSPVKPSLLARHFWPCRFHGHVLYLAATEILRNMRTCAEHPIPVVTRWSFDPVESYDK